MPEIGDRAATPTAIPPVSPVAIWCFIAVAGAAVGALALSIASIFLPVAKRTAAPFVCPDGTERSVVVLRIWGGKKKTTVASSLCCLDEHRGHLEMGGWSEFAGMSAAGGIGGSASSVIAVTIAKIALRRRRRR